MNEETEKITVELPTAVLHELRKRALEIDKSQKFIVGRSVLAFLTSNVRADDFARELIFGFHLSDNPEDRVEVPMTLEAIKMLHAQIHITLKKLGENPDEVKRV